MPRAVDAWPRHAHSRKLLWKDVAGWRHFTVRVWVRVRARVIGEDDVGVGEGEGEGVGEGEAERDGEGEDGGER